MAHNLNDDLEYRVQDRFDMSGFEEVEYWKNIREKDGEEFDLEDDVQEKSDTSALEYRKGKDIQGIPWGSLNYSREEYRKMRLKMYKNYESLPRSGDALDKECKILGGGCTFYDFQFNTRLVKPTIVHFQLRNLVWATSKHDVYIMQNYSVMHWSSLLRKGKQVLNVMGKLVPSQKLRASIAHQLTRVQISTMAVREHLMVAGGFQGELICKYLHRPGVDLCAKITEDNSITNTVDIFRSSNGSLRVSAANNDRHVRMFDVESFMELGRYPFSWSVNNSCVSPDGKLLAVLGDTTECLLADAQSGKVISILNGHLDYSFSSAWHPDGHILATGNQDRTCRLWDVRKLNGSIAVIKGRIGAIRGVKFSADGRYLAMAEPADFVHVIDVKDNYSESQEIDVFGEIAGVSFSPDSDTLFVGMADRTYGSLLEFRRRYPTQYLDAFL